MPAQLRITPPVYIRCSATRALRVHVEELEDQTRPGTRLGVAMLARGDGHPIASLRARAARALAQALLDAAELAERFDEQGGGGAPPPARRRPERDEAPRRPGQPPSSWVAASGRGAQ